MGIPTPAPMYPRSVRVPRLLDPNRADDEHIDQRLRQESIIWLCTTRPDGRPHNVPVWFLWTDPFILIFALAASRKVRNIRQNPAVVLNLDSAQRGTDIVLAEGSADLLTDCSVTAADTPEFVAKYTMLLGGASTFGEWGATFSQAVRVTVDRISAWTRTGEELRSRIITASGEAR